MKILPWYNRRVQDIADDEQVLYAQSCSYARADWLFSLVGGEIFVTSKRVIFVPNRLAALIGRQPWEHRLCEVTALGPEFLTRIKPVGVLPTLTLLIGPAADDKKRKRTVTMSTSESVAALSDAIERAHPQQ
jgi:hypothetical protein